MDCFIYNSKIGNIYVQADETWLYRVSFFPVKVTKINPIIQETIKQLDEYFSGVRKTFDLPLNPIGTEFQKKVWNELLKISYGKVNTYKDIANAIGNPNASRAIGNANNKNPIAIIIPCHRVIGSNGDIKGYAGGISIKQFLLKLELNEN